jgi:hypothetical protein
MTFWSFHRVEHTHIWYSDGDALGLKTVLEIVDANSQTRKERISKKLLIIAAQSSQEMWLAV